MKNNWILTHSGLKFRPMNPDPKEINIEDIAHALSNLCRFGGHCSCFYSVAEHSVLVSQNIFSTCSGYTLTGLLHDASEAYLVDVPKPIKRCLIGYYEIEDKLQNMIYQKFKASTSPLSERLVKYADQLMFLNEIEVLMRNPNRYFSKPSKRIDLHCLPPHLAEKLFLERFYEISEGFQETDKIETSLDGIE